MAQSSDNVTTDEPGSDSGIREVLDSIQLRFLDLDQAYALYFAEQLLHGRKILSREEWIGVH